MTTILYILISTDNDLYYEQALLSIYSLRQHHPVERVVLLVDRDTEATLHGRRAKIREYVSEVMVVDVPESYTPKERSRHLKTSFRRYLAGDLIFIDSDTVVTGNVMDMADVDGDVACVLDFHVQLDKTIAPETLVRRMQKIFGVDVSDEKRYYNSGVMFVRDTPTAKALFERWHEHWKTAAFAKGQCFDQPSLLMADRDCGHVIKELDGIYNCQVLASVQYLHRARIVHFFNVSWEGKELFSPFFRGELYREIKVSGGVPEKTARLVRECKSSFLSPSYYVCPRRLDFQSSLVGATVYSLYQKNGLSYKALKFFCKVRYFLARLKARLMTA